MVRDCASFCDHELKVYVLLTKDIHYSAKITGTDERSSSICEKGATQVLDL